MSDTMREFIQSPRALEREIFAVFGFEYWKSMLQQKKEEKKKLFFCFFCVLVISYICLILTFNIATNYPPIHVSAWFLVCFFEQVNDVFVHVSPCIYLLLA